MKGWVQEEGEEVHCNLGKTWRDLFKKQWEEWKGECRKKGKRYTVTEAKLGEIWWRSKGKKGWVQEEGEEVHCNLGKTWRDLFKK
jgi:hypothetical protein